MLWLPCAARRSRTVANQHENPMDEIAEVARFLSGELRRTTGSDKLEDDDTAVVLLNNGVVVFSMDDGELSVQVVGGEPFRMDYSLSIFEGDGDAH